MLRLTCHPFAAAAGAVVVLCSAAEPAQAIERRFSFTYESGVLLPGDAEIEPWTTFRVGRERYYSRLDQRLEFELGIVPNLQTALYWDASVVAEDSVGESGEVSRSSSTSLASVSSEWKYKISDPVADALGSALYVEGGYGPEQAKLEAKIILDKQSADLIVALNLVGEQEWDFASENTQSEQKVELDLAAGYFVSPVVVLGIEAVSTTPIDDGKLESSAIYVGPALAWAADRYWLALSVLPQVYAPKAADGETLDLEHGEQLRARLIMGFHL